MGTVELGLHSIADKVVFGRAPTCDIVLEHLSISRQHATLSTDTAGNLFLTDLGSGAALLCWALTLLMGVRHLISPRWLAYV